MGRIAGGGRAAGHGDRRPGAFGGSDVGAPSSTERRLREVLDMLPEAIAVADTQGSVVYRNAAAASMVGARHSDALAARAVEELIQEGVSATRLLELFGPPRRSLELTASRLPGGELAVVVHDVSERRQLDAVRRDFVANVSHELRTPIGALSVLAETLAEEDDPAVVRRLAGRLSAEAERATRMVEDLLDLSRLEAEHGQLRDPVDLLDVVDQAVERVSVAATQRGVALELDEPQSAVVTGSLAQLVSAVTNLLENGIKYTDAGGTVRLSVSDDDGWVNVVVTDDGIGIPARDLDRIFERFYRVDRARSRATGGTGLGLAIVRHVATNHGGTVSVASREGEGSTFTLRLPLALGDGHA